MNGYAAQQSFAELEAVAPLAADAAQNANGFARDFRADAVAGKNQNVQIHELVRSYQNSLPRFLNQRHDLLVHEAPSCDGRQPP